MSNALVSLACRTPQLPCYWPPRSRTPGPPPLASMNSAPAASSTRRMCLIIDPGELGCARGCSARRMVVPPPNCLTVTSLRLADPRDLAGSSKDEARAARHDLRRLVKGRRGHLDIRTSGQAHLISCELFNTIYDTSADVISTRRESMKNTMWKRGARGPPLFHRRFRRPDHHGQ